MIMATHGQSHGERGDVGAMHASPSGGHEQRFSGRRLSMDDSALKAIDCWVNPFTPEVAAVNRPEFLVRVATDYFHRADEVFKGTHLDEMVGMMESAGIGGGLLTVDTSNPAPMAEAAARYGDRFLLSAVIDPTQGMMSVRTVERLVREHDVRLIRMIPFLINRPPNDKV